MRDKEVGKVEKQVGCDSDVQMVKQGDKNVKV